MNPTRNPITTSTATTIATRESLTGELVALPGGAAAGVWLL
jgi:hypothetical protein